MLYKNCKIFIVCRVQFTLLIHFSIISQELLRFLAFQILEKAVLIIAHQQNKYCFSLYFPFILLIEPLATTQDSHSQIKELSHPFPTAFEVPSLYRMVHVQVFISLVGEELGVTAALFQLSGFLHSQHWDVNLAI